MTHIRDTQESDGDLGKLGHMIEAELDLDPDDATVKRFRAMNATDRRQLVGQAFEYAFERVDARKADSHTPGRGATAYIITWTVRIIVFASVTYLVSAVLPMPLSLMLAAGITWLMPSMPSPPDPTQEKDAAP